MEPCKALFRFVHSDVCEYIFGHNHQVSATKQTALEMSIKRKVPALSVYIISAYNDPYCEQLIEHLFADIFANLRKLRNGDFFTPDMGMSESMCTESVAALYACKVDYKGPVLYINFGSAITFYALDEKEHIIGGGISAGLRARFQALHDFCDDNEPIPYIEYTSIINKAIATNKPISLFSNDTPTATVASNIAELAGLLRNIVKQFIEQVRPENNRGGDANADGSTLNNNIDGNDDGTHRVDGELLGNIPAQNDSNNKGVDITDVNMEASKDTEGQLKAGETVEKLLPVPVVITGKESLAIINLLSAEGCSKIVSLEPGVTFPPDSSRAIFHRQNHMAFHGIENLLYTLSKVADPECPNRDDGLRERIVGLRVAKGVVVVSTREGTTTTESSNRRKSKVARVAQSSDVESPTERKYTSRGTVVRVAPGETFEEDMFQIVYDGDECVGEYVDLVGLYGRSLIWALTRLLEVLIVSMTFDTARSEFVCLQVLSFLFPKMVCVSMLMSWKSQPKQIRMTGKQIWMTGNKRSCKL
jgi:pantothenate kinase type III